LHSRRSLHPQRVSHNLIAYATISDAGGAVPLTGGDGMSDSSDWEPITPGGAGSRPTPGRGPTPAELEVWRLFLEAHALAVAALDRDLMNAGCRLDLREYDLLVALAAAGSEGVRLRNLADHLLINRSNVTRRIDALTGRGLVERRPDPEDGRGVVAVVTVAGTRALRRAATV